MPDDDSVGIEIDVIGGQMIRCRMAGSWVREQVQLTAHRRGADQREKLLTLVYNFLLDALVPAKSDVPLVVNDGKWTWIVPTRNILAVRFEDSHQGTRGGIGFRLKDAETTATTA